MFYQQYHQDFDTFLDIAQETNFNYKNKTSNSDSEPKQEPSDEELPLKVTAKNKDQKQIISKVSLSHEELTERENYGSIHTVHDLALLRQGLQNDFAQ